MIDENVLWQIRHFIYAHFADTTHAPIVGETAARFNISAEEAGEYYKELHNRHAFFVDVENLTIRMANPFSGIPTDFKVHANGTTYFANCAWDMLGIPAALHADAVIEAVCTESNETVQLEVKGGQISKSQFTNSQFTNFQSTNSQFTNSQFTNSQFTNSQLLVHFPLPFARWYDDLTFT